MKYGFVKVAAVSPKLKVADVKFNTLKIEEEIARQTKEGTEILVFPELCLCGYTCGDLFLQPLLSEACRRALKELSLFTRGISMLIFVGLPMDYMGKLYNCAAALCNGRVLGIVPKTHIPNYSEFYERRYFSPAPNGNIPDYRLWEEECTTFGPKQIFADEKNPEVKVACEICEDLWVGMPPSVYAASAGATIIVNLSASDETIGKADYRRMLVKSQSGKNVCAYVYSDAGTGESTTDMVFAGHNLIAENASVLSESLPFSKGRATAEIDASFLAAERRKLTTFTGTETPSDFIVTKTGFCGDGDLTLRKFLKRRLFRRKTYNSESVRNLFYPYRRRVWLADFLIRAQRPRSSEFPADSILPLRFSFPPGRLKFSAEIKRILSPLRCPVSERRERRLTIL